MPVDRPSRLSLIDRAETLKLHLEHLTPDDRAAGWQEQFATVCIGLIDEVRVCLLTEERMPEWINDRDMVMYFENPGILNGGLRKDILEFTEGLLNT
jgi:hypothetical protein